MRLRKNHRILAAGFATIGATLAVVVGLGVGMGTAAIAAAPQNTSPPTIKGTPQEGQTLTGDQGQWSGSPTAYTYVWTRCNKTGGSCTSISGATATTYKPVAADVGNTLRFKVDAKNADGTTTATSTPTAVVTAAKAGSPVNTSPPTITGTAQQGQKLTGLRGGWSGNSIQYEYYWTRCDKNGGSCANINSARDNLTYTLVAADVGNTVRFKVEGTNAGGKTTVSSAPSAIVAAAGKPVAAGCPAGTGLIQIANLGSPARLLVDQTQVSPSTISFGTTSLTARFHVTACGGRPVQGALVYVTAVPYNQFSIPNEQPTGSDGWATLQMNKLGGFPATPRQQLLVTFVRARKSGESLLGGISTRRLVSFRVTR